MEPQFFHHALKINLDACYGCTHCMTVCPTEAIRVKNGKAFIYEHKCIDCGMCLKACPANAIQVEQDDFSTIFNYKHRVALYPSVLTGQFPSRYYASQIAAVMLDLGFTHAFEVEHGADFLKKEIPKYQLESEFRPVISSFCPAIIRLIQVKFPSLANHVMQLKPPVDIAAQFYRKHLVDQGLKDEEIGIFYITPCAAKIAAIKSPVGESSSAINGVINMDFIFNRIFRALKQGKAGHRELPDKPTMSPDALSWSLTNGEAAHAKGRSIAIDGVMNSMDFLEQLEDEEISNIDFIEIRACDESCAGGILNHNNRFLTVERLKLRASRYKKDQKKTTDTNPIFEQESFLKMNSRIGAVKPRSMLKMDEDMTRALVKMEKTRRLMCFLPGIDCGACGAPNCQALAEDIVQHSAALTDCIFLQNHMQKHGKLSQETAHNRIEKIWGDKRLEKDCKRKGAQDETLF
ncbi:MAG: [Fe-Fe] hydrogenase large subunit C-terminal domain-containing protein [Salinivirgaceae bacterium]